MERIWIYQADRLLTESEENWLSTALQGFVAQWNAHGTPLAATAEIRQHIFVILKVDQEQTVASGCSIDSSVHFLKKVEQHLGISLFDRMHVAYEDPISGTVVVTQQEFRALLGQGKVTEETRVYNNLIQEYQQLDTDWLIPMRDSWHIKVFGSAPYTA